MIFSSKFFCNVFIIGQIFDILFFHPYFPDLEYLEDVKGFISGKKAKVLLVDQRNYTYTLNNKSKDSRRIWWKCYFYKTKLCTARATTFGNKITKLSGEHIHEPDYSDDI